jgi:hypothetical protein
MRRIGASALEGVPAVLALLDLIRLSFRDQVHWCCCHPARPESRFNK